MRVASTLSQPFLLFSCVWWETNQVYATLNGSGTMLRYATSLKNCGTPERSEPGEPPSTLERWSRRQPSRAERHFLLRRQGEHRSCVIHAKRRVRTSGPRSPAAARADASIGTRFSVEERTLSRPRRLLPSGRTLLAKAPVAVQLVRCVGLAVELLGSHAPPINAPAALLVAPSPARAASKTASNLFFKSAGVYHRLQQGLGCLVVPQRM